MKPTNYRNLALAGMTAAVLTACSSGGTCGSCAIPVPAGSKLIFVAPSILPSLANTTGINYMGVYNPTNTAISNISYSLGQIVGSGSSVTLDQNSAKACANIAAKSSCFLKLSVPESTIAGGAVVTASNSDGTEAATPLAIGVQQVPYTESANANGVGLYFYPKAQYSESGVPFMLATAVVQSPNVGNINTIELVDESGNLITGQYVTSGNSGAGAAQLTMGSVVQIVVPLPQGVNLSQNYKVRTSYQSTPSVLSTIAEKLGLANKQAQATSNETTGSQIYTVTTQGNNINLQFTPNQVYLTGTNPVQYGYLYNIGDLTASQIKVSSSSPNVRVTAADAILNGQRVIKVTYELINTTVAPTSNTVTVTAQNPAGQTETSTGGTNQNVNPLPVPTPSPIPTPTPTPTPGPVYPSLTLTSSINPAPGGSCSIITATVPVPVISDTIVTLSVPTAANSYGFAASSPYPSSTTCTISTGNSSCSTSADVGGNLCAAASSTVGSMISVTGSAAGYTPGSVSTTIMAQYLYSVQFANNSAGTIYQCAIDPYTGNITGGCSDASTTPDSLPIGAAGITFNKSGSLVYLTNQNFGQFSNFFVSVCPMVNKLIDTPNCSTYAGPTPNTTFVAPTAIILNNTQTKAYIANNVDSSIVVCDLADNGLINNNSCTNVALSTTGYYITLNPDNSYLYVTNGALSPNGKVSKCALNIDGSVGACTDAGGGSFVTPAGIVVNSSNTIAYIVNTVLSPSVGYVSKCTIDPTTKNFTTCTSTGTNIDNSDGITFDKGESQVYINHNVSGEITKCKIDPITKDLTDCTIAKNGLNSPLIGISYY